MGIRNEWSAVCTQLYFGGGACPQIRDPWPVSKEGKADTGNER